MMQARRLPELRNLPRWLLIRFHALRAFSFPVSVFPVLVVTAVVRPFAGYRWDVLAASVLGVMLLHAAGNLLNDYFDHRYGVDRKLAGDEGRPGRLLVRGDLAPGDVLVEAAACLALVAPVTVYLVWRCGPALLWFGGAAALCLYAYTGPPFHFKYKALGEPLIFLTFGPLLVTGAAYAQTGHWEWPALLVSIPIGLATTAVLLGNNIRDSHEDAAGGIRTLVHRLGPHRAYLTYAAAVLLPPCVVAVLVAAGIVGAGALLCLISLVPGCSLVLRVRTSARLPDIDVRTARCAALFFLTTWLGAILT